MNKIIILIIASSIPLIGAEIRAPKTQTEKFSYAVGMQIGDDFKSKEMELDFEIFMEGVKASYLSNKTLISENDKVSHSFLSIKTDASSKPFSSPKGTAKKPCLSA